MLILWWTYGTNAPFLEFFLLFMLNIQSMLILGNHVLSINFYTSNLLICFNALIFQKLTINICTYYYYPICSIKSYNAIRGRYRFYVCRANATINQMAISASYCTSIWIGIDFLTFRVRCYTKQIYKLASNIALR